VSVDVGIGLVAVGGTDVWVAVGVAVDSAVLRESDVAVGGSGVGGMGEGVVVGATVARHPVSQAASVPKLNWTKVRRDRGEPGPGFFFD
jgi:hypothetical protein